MKLTVRFNNKENIIDDALSEDVIEQLDAINSMNIEDYEILVEDVDESTLQIMNGGLFVGIPTDKQKIYCRYTNDVVDVDLLEEAIEDFFDGDTDLSYIDWDHDLDDYVHM
jgi:hypothetical protein